MVMVVTGLAEESRIAAGPGVSQIVCSGSNPDRLRGELAHIDVRRLRAVISFGIAGGLNPSLKPGDAVIATEVATQTRIWKVTEHLALSLEANLLTNGINPVKGSLIGVEKPVFFPTQKKQLYKQTNAAAVDMESHIVADFADRNNLPFAAVRVISDPAARALPELAARALKPDGRVDFFAVIKGIARTPSQIVELIRAGGDAGRAFAELRRCRRLLDFGLCFGFADL